MVVVEAIKENIVLLIFAEKKQAVWQKLLVLNMTQIEMRV
jgi:hypothetical protein